MPTVDSIKIRIRDSGWLIHAFPIFLRVGGEDHALAEGRSTRTPVDRSHTFRHSFATHVLESGYDIRTVQELLGHHDVKITMMDIHVLNRDLVAVRSPVVDRHLNPF